jgi:hypothetical protein
MIMEYNKGKKFGLAYPLILTPFDTRPIVWTHQEVTIKHEKGQWNAKLVDVDSNSQG